MLPLILLALGALLLLIGAILFIVAGFRFSILWGVLALLFLPFAALIITFLNWPDSRRALACILPGLLLLGAGAWLAPDPQSLIASTASLLPPSVFNDTPAPPENPIAPPSIPATPAPAEIPPAPELDESAIAAATTSEQIVALARQLEARRNNIVARQKQLDPNDTAAAEQIKNDILALNRQGRDLKAAAENLHQQQQQQQQPPQEPPAELPPTIVPPAPPSATARPVWTLDLTGAAIPAAPATGTLDGRDFTPDRAEIDPDNTLTLRQGSDTLPDLALTLYLFVPKGETLAGRTFDITPDTGVSAPHIMAKWKKTGKDTPEKKLHTTGYALRLTFGQPENGRLPGQCYLALPDSQKTVLAGTFQAVLP